MATTTYEDSGLLSGTSYSYTIAGVASGAPGASSAAVNDTTSGKPPPPPPIAPPTGLAISGATNTTITIDWDAVTDAASYKVYLDDATTGVSTGAATTFTDKNLQPDSMHSFAVSSVDSHGSESDRSLPVTGKTKPAYQCQTFTASNYAHVQAGRAHDVAGHAHANGSEQDMGLDNTLYKTTLAETKADYYQIGQCP